MFFPPHHGARLSVTTSQFTQIDEVRGGGSYNSTNDTRLQFGLGPDTPMKKVEVFWPSGARQSFADLQADALYELTEDKSIHKIKDLPVP